MEEFGPKLVYIKGKKNVIADTLSRLSRREDKDVSPIVGKSDAPSSDTNIETDESFYSFFDDSELIDCFYQGIEKGDNLLDFIKDHDCFLRYDCAFFHVLGPDFEFLDLSQIMDSGHV